MCARPCVQHWGRVICRRDSRRKGQGLGKVCSPGAFSLKWCSAAVLKTGLLALSCRYWIQMLPVPGLTELLFQACRDQALLPSL